jgi:hypothetical protein
MSERERGWRCLCGLRLKVLWKLASSWNWFGSDGCSWKKPAVALDGFMVVCVRLPVLVTEAAEVWSRSI